MLVRFIKSGPVKAGPVFLHGMPGQVADLEGDDLQAAIADGMVEPDQPKMEPDAPAKPRRARK